MVQLITRKESEKLLTGLYQTEEHYKEILKAKSIWKYPNKEQETKTLYLIAGEEEEDMEEPKKEKGSYQVERGLGTQGARMLNEAKIEESEVGLS